MSTLPPSEDAVDPVLPPTSPANVAAGVPNAAGAARGTAGAVQPGDYLGGCGADRAWCRLAAGLLVAFGDGQHSAQLDAIKTAGAIVLGTGGAAALWLTARRQRTSELSL